MKIDNRQKLLGTLAIGVVVLWAANQIIISPLSTAWTTRSKRIKKYKEDVATGTQIIQRDPVIRKQWGDWRSHTLPADDPAAESELAAAMYRWKTVSDVTIVSVRPTWRKGEDENYRTLECKTDLSGTLGGISRFIYEIERDPLAVKVNTVGITRKDDSGQQLSFTVEISCLQLNPAKVKL